MSTLWNQLISNAHMTFTELSATIRGETAKFSIPESLLALRQSATLQEIVPESNVSP